jgi:HK97 family phage portal protein
MADDLAVTKSHSAPMSDADFVNWMSSNMGSIAVTEVLQQTAFLLCCDVIAQDMAKAELRLRKRLPNGTSEVVMPTKHALAGMLAMEPNDRHTWFDFKEMMGLWGALTMNAYAVVFRTRLGDPEKIVPLQSGQVQTRVADNGAVFYYVSAGTNQQAALLGSTSVTVPERDMIHVRGRMLDGMDGYSTMIVGRNTLDTGASMEEFRTALFSDEGQIRGVFTREGDKYDILPEEAFARLRKQLGELMKRFRKYQEPIVLEGGLKFMPTASNPQEMELYKQWEAQVLQTCRLLRIPPHKVFHTTDVKYDNMETVERLYVNDTLVPICQRFEQRYAKVLLSREDRLKYFIEHDRDMMVVRDTKLETDRLYRMVTTGVIEVDEARVRTGFNPLPGGAGQVRLFPVNMNVVDRDNEIVVSAPTKPAPSDEPAPADDADPEDASEDATPAKALRIVK